MYKCLDFLLFFFFIPLCSAQLIMAHRTQHGPIVTMPVNKEITMQSSKRTAPFKERELLSDGAVRSIKVI